MEKNEESPFKGTVPPVAMESSSSPLQEANHDVESSNVVTSAESANVEGGSGTTCELPTEQTESAPPAKENVENGEDSVSDIMRSDPSHKNNEIPNDQDMDGIPKEISTSAAKEYSGTHPSSTMSDMDKLGDVAEACGKQDVELDAEPTSEKDIVHGVHLAFSGNEDADWTMCYIQNLPNRYGPVTMLNIFMLNDLVDNDEKFQRLIDEAYLADEEAVNCFRDKFAFLHDVENDKEKRNTGKKAELDAWLDKS